MKKIFNFIAATVSIILFVLGALVVFSLLPMSGNIKLLTVLSGSMEPSIGTGSLIFIKPADKYEIGDVVTMKTEQKDVTVTHRIVSSGEADGKTFFRTKGDANNVADNEKISQDMIVGRVFIFIPLLGYLVNFTKTTQGIILIIMVPAILIVYDEIGKIRKEAAKMREDRKLKMVAEDKRPVKII